MTSASRTKLGIIQRVLPTYRAPLFDALAIKHGFDVQVFAGTPGNSEGIQQAQGLTQARLVNAISNIQPPIVGPPLSWQRGLIPWLSSFNPDVIVADINPWMLSTRVAVKWMHRRDRPVIGWGLGMLPSRWPAVMFKTLVYRRALKQFDRLIAYGTKAADDFETLGFDRGRVSIAFNSTSPAPAGDRPTLEMDAGGVPTLIFVGRLTRGKQVELLFEAVSLVDLPVEVVIVGDGPDEARLRKLAPSSVVPVRFVGRQTGDNLARFLDTASLFVLPAAGGLAIQEAMARGLPVVASFADGTERDLVRDGQNGFLVHPGDVPSLAAAIKRVISDSSLHQRFGAESYRIASEEVNLDIMARQFADAVRAALNGGPARGG